MSDDVRYRFWGHLGYDVTIGKTFTADATEFGAELMDVYVETLLPSHSDTILHHVPYPTGLSSLERIKPST
jgi:hypothetical protein